MVQTQNVSLPCSTGTAFGCSRFLLSSRTTMGVGRNYGFSTTDDSAVCQSFLFKRDTKRETEACQRGRSHKGWGRAQPGHPTPLQLGSTWMIPMPSHGTSLQAPGAPSASRNHQTGLRALRLCKQSGRFFSLLSCFFLRLMY